MNSFLYSYQHLPYHINPVFFSAGFFHISWYAMMYLVSFLVVYCLLKYRINKGGYDCEIKNQKSNLKIANQNLKFLNGLLLDFLLYAFVGLIIGARLGEVLFYNLPYYMAHPLAIISPFDPATGKFIGIYGMSYHGGLIGVIVATVIFCKKYKLDFWQWANFIVPAIPAGYFFGRIGNFINGELYGRVTAVPWGMYFPGAVKTHCNASLQCANQLRHPSQFYEAILEGIILFSVLWPARNKKIMRENALAIYIIGYASLRFLVEFFREPDSQSDLLAGYLTVGQLLSVAMLILGIVIFLKTKKSGMIMDEKEKQKTTG